MHIIIGAIIALGTLFWAVSRLVDTASDAKASARRFRWSRKHNKRLIDTLEDPREAAAILMLQVAAYEGDITEKQKTVILGEIKSAFQASSGEAEEFYGFARHVLGETPEVANVLRRVLAPIQTGCSDREKQELLEMLETVAALDSEPNHRQISLINKIRSDLS